LNPSQKRRKEKNSNHCYHLCVLLYRSYPNPTFFT
jgi:hypothetical protein